MSGLLFSNQVDQYNQEGYLLVSGLIPNSISVKAEQEMWHCSGVDADKPETWSNGTIVENYFNDDIVACYTDEFITVAAQLAGDDPATYSKPEEAHSLNVFPSTGDWSWPSPHIDHSIKKDGYKTFPRAFRIAAMTYLSDVEEHGGGTIVWPRSHHYIWALAKSNPTCYEYMWVLGNDIHQVDLGTPMELTPNRGDVLFYHFLCAHSGSKNVNSQPRFALNTKW